MSRGREIGHSTRDLRNSTAFFTHFPTITPPTHLLVVGTKVVAPLRYTVGLVDHHPVEKVALKKVENEAGETRVGGNAFRRAVKDVDPRRVQPALVIDFPSFLRRD